MFQSHKLSVKKTAHYYSIGSPGAHIKELWIACHGYGQLASDFIQELAVLDNGERLIVAPEGLSRFYWGGFIGPYAASWMTSKDRLDEIADYCCYLRTLLEKLQAQLPAGVKLNLLGFSQGSATLCRWLTSDKPDFSNLILWAGLFPEDIDYYPLREYLENKNLYFVYGLKDRFLTAVRKVAHEELIKAQELKVKQITFDGKHSIDTTTLKKLAANLHLS